MNFEPSQPARPSSSTRRTVRHLAVAGILTIPIAACSSDDSDTPTAAGTAAPTVPTTASAPTETPTSTDAPPRPAATQPPNSSAPATAAPPSAPEAQEAIALAQRFVDARDAWDGEAVRALVADDAVIDDFAVSNADDYLPGAEIERATGWRYMQPQCTAIVPGPPIQVSCTYTMQNAWSQALGVGPFTGSNFKFVIANGQIQQVTHIFDFSEFDPQVFAVFFAWLTATPPQRRRRHVATPAAATSASHPKRSPSSNNTPSSSSHHSTTPDPAERRVRWPTETARRQMCSNRPSSCMRSIAPLRDETPSLR